MAGPEWECHGQKVFQCTVCAVPAESQHVALIGFDVHDSWITTSEQFSISRPMPEAAEGSGMSASESEPASGNDDSENGQRIRI